MKWEEILKSMFVNANKAYKELGFIYGGGGIGGMGSNTYHLIMKDDEDVINNIMSAIEPYADNQQRAIGKLHSLLHDYEYDYNQYGEEYADDRLLDFMTPEKILQQVVFSSTSAQLKEIVENNSEFLLVNVTPDSYNFVGGDPEMFKMIKEKLE